MREKMKRTVAAVAALAALALGGAAIAGATGNGSNSPAPATKALPAVDNHADGETNDDGPAAVDNHADGETNDDNGAAAKDTPEHGESAGDADGSAHAEATEAG
jgi:hypothetical protein